MASMSYKIHVLYGWPPALPRAVLLGLPCACAPRARSPCPARPSPLRGGWRARARSRPALGARRGVFRRLRAAGARSAPRAFGAQATHADARCARDRSVRKIKNARIRKDVHKIHPCHFRGHVLCWKLQGTPFPLQNARASCGSRIQEEPPYRAALSLS